MKSKSWSGTRTFGPDFHPFSDTDISPPPRYVKLHYTKNGYLTVHGLEFLRYKKAKTIKANGLHSHS